MKKLHFRVPNKVLYTNWKGERRERLIEPRHVYFGSTEYHKEPQFLIEAVDLEKKEVRHFALKDMELLTNE